jgi:hypothetical protein
MAFAGGQPAGHRRHLDPARIDVVRYEELLLRAAANLQNTPDSLSPALSRALAGAFFATSAAHSPPAIIAARIA